MYKFSRFVLGIAGDIIEALKKKRIKGNQQQKEQVIHFTLKRELFALI